MKTIDLIILLLMFSIWSSAQSTISGKVSDNTGAPLIGANIYLQGTYDGTTSKTDGSFVLTSTEKGEHILCIDYIGFEKIRKPVVLQASSIELTIVLKEEFNELNAVNITAGTFEAGDKMKSVKVSSLDMVTTAGSSGDIYGALQALPGTTTVGESGKLFVKGGDSRESKTFIDGTLVHAPYTASSPNTAVRSRFSPFMFSGTMFSTGGYSAEYGQALSSVLALNTHEKAVEDQVNLSILTIGGELGATKSWEKSSLNASFSYNNMAPYMNLIPQNKNYLKAPETKGGEIAFRLKTAKSGLLKIYTNISQSKLGTAEQNLSKPNETIDYNLTNRNAFINSSWQGEVAKDWILYSGVSYTYNTDEVNMTSQNIQEKLKASHSKFTLKHSLSKQIKIQTGMEVFTQYYSLKGTDVPHSFAYHYKGELLSSFIESEVYASNHFVSRIGARFEYDTYLKKKSLSPRLSAAYKLSNNSQLSCSYGWFYQNPENEYLLYSRNLDFERADHLTLNYIHNHNKRTLRSEIYYKDYKSLIKYSQNEILSNEELTNKGYGSAYGIDLFWRDRKSIKFLEYWVSYSYINTKRNFKDYPHESTPGFASTNNLNIVLKYWLGALRSQIGASYAYASPRVYNNPNSARFNNEKTSPYHSVDANWSYLYRQNIIFHFMVSNVLGFNHQYGQRYAAAPNDKGFYNSAPIVPSAKRFFLVGCFITLSKKGDINQLDKIN